MTHELYIPPKRIYYNPINGQFLKGHPNCNKGKKWNEFMPKKAQRRCKKGWVNVDKYRCTKNGGKNKKQVVAVDKEGRWTVFDSARKAAMLLQVSQGNITRCCQRNQQKEKTDHHVNNIRFYYANENTWMSKIKQQ